MQHSRDCTRPGSIGLALSALALPFLLASQAVAQRILYVDQTAPPSRTNDGLSWCKAFDDLQDALDLAGSDVIIRVASGVYKPDRRRGDRLSSFVLSSGVSIEGGYAGCGAAFPDQRDFVRFETVLSGDLAGNDVGELGDPSRDENSYHVVRSEFDDPTAILDGFTITAGKANQVLPTNDTVGLRGGGLLIEGSSPTIKSCRFIGNFAELMGGAASVIAGSPSFTDCAFIGNACKNRGGAFAEFPIGSSLSSTFTRCNFIANSATTSGALSAESVTLSKCRFLGNTATEHAGGATVGENSRVQDCIFSGNSAGLLSGEGGGLRIVASGVEVTGCTFSRNSARRGWGLDVLVGIETVISNCIFWVNEIRGTGALIDHSNIPGNWPGEGNINATPMFVDADGVDDIYGTADDDLRLLLGSPSIDTGAPTFGPGVSATDLDGNPRVRDGNGDGTSIVDMGALEAPSGCLGIDTDGDGLPDACDVCDFTPVGMPVDEVGRPCADLNHDCKVDLLDFAIFQASLR